MNEQNVITFDNDDIFNRRNLAYNLSRVAEESTNSVVIAVDSFWGSGKTTFIRKWKNILDTEGKNTIYIDAWENDYFKDPIIPLIGHLEHLLKLSSVQSDDVKGAMKTIAYEIVKSVSVVVDLEKIESGFATAEREHLSVFKNLDREKEIIKKRLEEVSKESKVYVFIDELDRCKPSFSISLLERIKHYFSLENFIFVLAVDLSQLGHSVRSIYGDINTKAYFRKFFDFNFHLPAPEKVDYFNFLFRSNGIEHIKQQTYIRYISNIIKNSGDIGLRECNKIFDIIRVCNHKIIEVNANEYIFPYLIVFKVLEPEKYKQILAKEISIDEKTFENQNLEKVYEDYNHIQNMIKLLSPYTTKERQEAGKEAFGHFVGRSEVVEGFYDYMNNILEFANLF